MKRVFTLQVLVWICALFFFVPRVGAQGQPPEDAKKVTGRYKVVTTVPPSTTVTPFYEVESLEKALEGATLNTITELEFTGGKLETADWDYLNTHATDFASLAKLTVASSMNEVAAMSMLLNLPALKEASVAKVSSLNKFDFPATIERIYMPDCKDVYQSATNYYTNLKVLHLPRLNAFGNYQFENCASTLDMLILGENENKMPASVLSSEGEYWVSDLFNGRHPKLTFSAPDGSDLPEDKYNALVKAYKEIEDGNTGDNFWWGFEIMPYTSSTQYTLTTMVTPNEGGRIVVSPEGTKFKEGTPITLTVEHNHGYQFQKLELVKTEAPNDPITHTDGAFSMPAANVTAKATFTENTLKVQFTGEGIDKSYTGRDMAAILAQVTDIDKTKVKKIAFTEGTFDATDYKALSDRFATDFTGVRSLSVETGVSHCVLAEPGQSLVLPAHVEELSLANLTAVPNKFFVGTKCKTVHLPQTTTVGQESFKGCTQLTTLDAPQLATIEKEAFSGCTALAELQLLKLSSMKQKAFAGCTALTKLTLCGETVPTVDEDAAPFEGCPAERNLTLKKADGGDYTPQEIHGLRVTFDDGDKVYHDGKWFGWVLPVSNLYEIKYENDMHGKISGNNLAAAGETVTVTVTPDPGYKFVKLYYEYNGTTQEFATAQFTMPAANITLKASFTALPLEVLVNGTATGSGDGLANALAAAEFPEAKLGEVTTLTLKAGTFQNWSEWKSLSAKLTKLTTFTVLEGVGLGYMTTNEPIFTAPSLTTVEIATKLDAVAERAFAGAQALTTVKLLKTESVGDGAFAGCVKLATVELPALTANGLGKNSFAGCTALTTVTLSEAVTSIAESVFSGCTALATIPNAAKIATISESAFMGCTALTEVQLPLLGALSKFAFKGCTGITKVVCPELESIEENAFENCGALTTIEASKLTTLGSKAFVGCKKLAELNFPALSELEGAALQGCTGLTKCSFPLLTKIGEAGLQGCTGLTSLNLPSLETIEKEGLKGCTGLTKLKTVKLNTVEESAFAGCTKLATLVVGQHPESYSKGASTGCAAKREIIILCEDNETFKEALAAFKADTEEPKLYVGGKWDGWTLPTVAPMVLSFSVKMKGETDGVMGAMVTLMDANDAVLGEEATNADGIARFIVKATGTYHYNIKKDGCVALMNQACEVKAEETNMMNKELEYITYTVSFKTEPAEAKDHVTWEVMYDGNPVTDGMAVRANAELSIHVEGKDDYRVSELKIEGESTPLADNATWKLTKNIVLVATVVKQQYSVTFAAPQNGKLEVTNGGAAVISGAMLDTKTQLTLKVTPEEKCELLSLVAKVAGKEDQTLAEGGKEAKAVNYELVANVEFVATFKKEGVPQYTVTFDAPTNGTLTVKNGSADVTTGATLDANTELTLTVTPATGYELETLVAVVAGTENDLAKDKKGSKEAVTVTYTLAADVTLKATFKAVENQGGDPTKYTVTFDAPQNGTLEVKKGTENIATGKALDKDTELTLTVTPAANYELETLVATVGGNDTDLLPADKKGSKEAVAVTYKLEANVTFTATFKEVKNDPPISAPQYTVTFDAPTNGTLTVKNGTADVATGATLDANTELTLTATPAQGYALDKLVAVVGSETKELAKESKESVAVTYKLEANVTFKATFKAVQQGGDPKPQYKITFDAPQNGTLEVKKGTENITTGTALDKDTELTLTVTPAANYELETLVAVVAGTETDLAKDKKGSKDAVTVTYKLEANVTFTATFKEVKNDPPISAPQYTVTFDAPTNGTLTVKNGSADVATGATLDANTELTLTVTPAANYELETLVATVGGNDTDLLPADKKGSKEAVAVTYKLEANVTFTATFKEVKNDPPISAPQYTVTFDAPTNGTLTVKNGTADVATGATLDANTELTLTATPAQGYALDKLVAVVGSETKELAKESKEAVTVTYKLEANVTFKATFKKVTNSDNPKPNAVEDVQLAQVRAFPNPFATELRIDAQNVQLGLRYTLFDALGNPLLSGRCEQAISLETTSLLPGIYFLRLTTPAGAERVMKLVKK